jgi:hypothetical protein
MIKAEKELRHVWPAECWVIGAGWEVMLWYSQFPKSKTLAAIA